MQTSFPVVNENSRFTSVLTTILLIPSTVFVPGDPIMTTQLSYYSLGYRGAYTAGTSSSDSCSKVTFNVFPTTSYSKLRAGMSLHT